MAAYWNYLKYEMDERKKQPLDAYLKLFISDIYHCLNGHSELAFLKRDIPEVKKVNIMGAVISIKKYNERTLYEVDDGTGIILCSIRNADPDDTQEMATMQLQDELISGKDLRKKCITDGLQSILTKVVNKRIEDEMGYNLGSIILVLGNVRIIHDRPQIDVYHHCRIEDPNVEYQRILQQLTLYYHMY